MNTDFEELNLWAAIKKGIYQKVDRPHYRERDVWWTSIGFNIGDESFGKNKNFERPVLVLKKFNNNIFIGAPLSTKIKDGKYYSSVFLNSQTRSVMLSQIRLMDAKRIIRKIGCISNTEFDSVLKSLVKILK